MNPLLLAAEIAGIVGIVGGLVVVPSIKWGAKITKITEGNQAASARIEKEICQIKRDLSQNQTTVKKIKQVVVAELTHNNGSSIKDKTDKIDLIEKAMNLID